MTRHAYLRQILANVVTAWQARRRARGIGRLIAKRQEHAALDALVEALSEIDEPLAGVIWTRAYRVALFWAQNLSIQRAMEQLVEAHKDVVGGDDDQPGTPSVWDKLRATLR